MKRTIRPARKVSGTIRVPGDKSIAHRAAILSILARGPIRITNFPESSDCRASLAAAEQFGVTVSREGETLVLTPPANPTIENDTVIDCANSGTTVRLLAGLIAGSPWQVRLTGDESLSGRPMKRITEPLTAMGAEAYDTEGHLPLQVNGRPLLPFEYRLPIPSAQVKSAVLLAGLMAHCSVTVREDILTRDHTELMIQHLGAGLDVRDIKALREPDPHDPRKVRVVMPGDFKREINLAGNATVNGGDLDIPGDISTAAFFFAAAALSRMPLTVEQVGLNPTRTAMLDHLKAIGCTVEIANRRTASNETRGDVTVTGPSELKARRISGENTARMIDEIPALAIIAAFANGTTVIRDAAELKVKESDRLAAISDSLSRMGIKCGLLDDGLAIEGAKTASGADFETRGDHRIAMAFSIAALFADGPSTIDDASVVDVSCPGFYDLLEQLIA